MEKNTYKASSGKTFVFFMIYLLVSDVIGMLIVFLLSLEYLKLKTWAEYMDTAHVMVMFTLYLIMLVLFMIPLLLLIPYIRKLIIDMDIDNTPSANNAILWMGIIRLVLGIMSARVYSNWSTYSIHYILFVYFMIIYFHYKSKLNAQIENIERTNAGESYANKQNIENSNIKRSNIEKLDINKVDVKISDINKSDIKNQDIEDFDVEELDVEDFDIEDFDINEPDMEKLDIEEFDID